MKIHCDACKMECDIIADGPTDLKAAMPKGWIPRRIDGQVYNLCDVCGNIAHFVGGLSAYLQDRLGLPNHVEFDHPEEHDLSFWTPRLPEYSVLGKKTRGKTKA